MADINDVSTVIASALDEIGVNGTLDVTMDGEEVVEAVGPGTADDVEIVGSGAAGGGGLALSISVRR